MNVAVAYYVSRQHQVGKHIRGETNVIAAVGTASERIPEIRMRILNVRTATQYDPGWKSWLTMSRASFLVLYAVSPVTVINNKMTILKTPKAYRLQ